jgi:HSP20 family protein
MRFAMTGFIRFHRAPVNAFAAAGVERLFDSVAAELFGEQSARVTALRADVRESASAYVVTVDVPGIAKDAIAVDVDEKLAKIEATFSNAAAEGETALVSERQNGVLSREFKFVNAIDAAAATAAHEHGVLTLTLPKKSAASQKRITIN